MNDYKPNPTIISRAVHLWKELLSRPVYDNGDPSETGFLASAMASMTEKNNSPEVLERFGEELAKILSEPFEYGSGTDHKYTMTVRELCVDYGPCDPLQTAADRAGLKMQFPWKTRMYLREDSLTFRVGYGRPPQAHYPLSGDRWLVCDLHGDDVAKILQAVEAGALDLNLEPVSIEKGV